jgi:hypothetical protein
MPVSGLTVSVASVLLLALLVVGCSETTTTVEPEDLNPPLGLYSVTGDGEVDLAWYTSNFESDLDGYCVYIYDGAYGSLGSRSSVPAGFALVDCLEITPPSSGLLEVTVVGLVNGETYSFLVVAATDEWEKTSYTSNVVIDTPRPEVMSLTLKDENDGQGDCALRFSTSAPYVEVVDEDDPGAAVVFESFNAGLGKRSGFVGWQQRAQIQDLGFMADWDGADVAPTDGYPASDFSVTAIRHHVYAVKTASSNYAKIYVHNITGDPADNSDVAAIWVAYQTDAGNPELAPALPH